MRRHHDWIWLAIVGTIYSIAWAIVLGVALYVLTEMP